jgi:hypothetical protein
MIERADVRVTQEEGDLAQVLPRLVRLQHRTPKNQELSFDLAFILAYFRVDYRQNVTKQKTPKKMKQVFKDAPFRFDKDDWLSFFAAHGWTLGEKILANDESVRVKRRFPLMFPWSLMMLILPKKAKEKWRQSTGYVLYRK